MGGFYIALERRIPGIDPLVDGKGLSHASEAPEEAATTLEVRPLTEFFSAGEAELEDLLGKGADLPEAPPKQFFDAAEGLWTARALIDPVDRNPGTLRRPERVPEDLREFEKILAAAKAGRVRWHLAIDY